MSVGSEARLFRLGAPVKFAAYLSDRFPRRRVINKRAEFSGNMLKGDVGRLGRSFALTRLHGVQHHEHGVGATSAHNRPVPGRVDNTRTQARAGSMFYNLVWSFEPASCGSDHTGS